MQGESKIVIRSFLILFFLRFSLKHSLLIQQGDEIVFSTYKVQISNSNCKLLSIFDFSVYETEAHGKTEVPFVECGSQFSISDFQLLGDSEKGFPASTPSVKSSLSLFSLTTPSSRATSAKAPVATLHCNPGVI
ncbi:unnamed protein product [Citrullus colocynthis]|uniref:Uncharacterized protein n=1 Tax=Citrullus colocynthis TaxID=252529 RepID=A0ABP0Z7I9_9ROSI